MYILFFLFKIFKRDRMFYVIKIKNKNKEYFILFKLKKNFMIYNFNDNFFLLHSLFMSFKIIILIKKFSLS